MRRNKSNKSKQSQKPKTPPQSQVVAASSRVSSPGRSLASRTASASPSTARSSAAATTGLLGLALSAIAAYLGLPEATAAAVGAFFGISASAVFTILGGVGVGLVALTVPRLIARLRSAGGSGQGGEAARGTERSGGGEEQGASTSRSKSGKARQVFSSPPPREGEAKRSRSSEASGERKQSPALELPEANQIKKKFEVKGKGKDLKAVFNHYRFLLYRYWRTLYDIRQVAQ